MSSTASSIDLADPPLFLRRTLKQKMSTFFPSGSSTGCWSSVGLGPVYCRGKGIARLLSYSDNKPTSNGFKYKPTYQVNKKVREHRYEIEIS